MPVIRIPSSNIYKIEYGSILSKNKIEKASCSETSFAGSRGNVLLKSHQIIYWDVYKEPIGDSVALQYVGNNTDYNEIVGEKVSIPTTVPVEMTQLNDATLLVGNNVKFYGNPSSGKVRDGDCVVVRERKYITVYQNQIEDEHTFVKTESTGLTYNQDLNAFEYSLNTTQEYDPSENIYVNGVTVLTYQAADRREYLVSEKITIEANYKEPKELRTTYGTNNNSSFELPSNELLQAETTQDLSGDSSFVLSTLMRVVNKYKKGKEVCTIKCAIADYYDTTGGLTICPSKSNYPMCFDKHQIVVPYVFTSNGEVPFSEKADGTPKQFEIIGIDYTYRGVVWQELTLQEHIQ